VVDDNNQTLAYVYFEDESVRQSTMKRIGKGDAYQLARAISLILGCSRGPSQRRQQFNCICHRPFQARSHLYWRPFFYFLTW
jgi:hypothetical protein